MSDKRYRELERRYKESDLLSDGIRVLAEQIRQDYILAHLVEHLDQVYHQEKVRTHTTNLDYEAILLQARRRKQLPLSSADLALRYNQPLLWDVYRYGDIYPLGYTQNYIDEIDELLQSRGWCDSHTTIHTGIIGNVTTQPITRCWFRALWQSAIPPRIREDRKRHSTLSEWSSEYPSTLIGVMVEDEPAMGLRSPPDPRYDYLGPRLCVVGLREAGSEGRLTFSTSFTKRVPLYNYPNLETVLDIAEELANRIYFAENFGDAIRYTGTDNYVEGDLD